MLFSLLFQVLMLQSNSNVYSEQALVCFSQLKRKFFSSFLQLTHKDFFPFLRFRSTFRSQYNLGCGCHFAFLVCFTFATGFVFGPLITHFQIGAMYLCTHSRCSNQDDIKRWFAFSRLFFVFNFCRITTRSNVS